MEEWKEGEEVGLGEGDLFLKIIRSLSLSLSLSHSGYFTSRPALKRYIRAASTTLQSAKQVRGRERERERNAFEKESFIRKRKRQIR